MDEALQPVPPDAEDLGLPDWLLVLQELAYRHLHVLRHLRDGFKLHGLIHRAGV